MAGLDFISHNDGTHEGDAVVEVGLN